MASFPGIAIIIVIIDMINIIFDLIVLLAFVNAGQTRKLEKHKSNKQLLEQYWDRREKLTGKTDDQKEVGTQIAQWRWDNLREVFYISYYGGGR